jgi:hypothetical protein
MDSTTNEHVMTIAHVIAIETINSLDGIDIRRIWHAIRTCRINPPGIVNPNLSERFCNKAHTCVKIQLLRSTSAVLFT